jgi:DNA polymerase I-like protein with 3'-5' exonuclease and polymerase domains
MRRLVFDIETDGLKPKVIHCIVAIDIDTKEEYVYRSDRGNLDDFRDLLNKPCELIGHNIIGYDVPVCERLMGIDFKSHKITDTLVMSRLANPSRLGGHSLKVLSSGGDEEKTHHEDWSIISDDMVVYCVQDVRANVGVYWKLLDELKDFDDQSISLEHQVQTIVQRQVRTGWLLDVPKCYDLLAELKERKMSLEDEVHKRFKPKFKFIKIVTPKVKKDGTFSSVGLKFLGDQWLNVAGEFSRLDVVPFNLGSRQQIGEYLKDFGWKPKALTPTGQPVVDEKVLKGVKNIPEARLIAYYLMVQKRIAQVDSWLTSLDEDTGRVHGYVNPNGAVTGRMTHSSPNVAQVPAVYSEYGKQCRSCWIVKEGYKLVGCDASGLELRMLAHYMDDDKYTYEVLNGDIHTANQNAAGLDTRDQAKTFIYAFLYGAGDAEIGSIVGGSAKVGGQLKAKFLSNTPSLEKLRQNVEFASRRGYLKGLDGRRVYVRSAHSALNTLLQSAGAIVMKKALIILEEYATIWGLDYAFVGNIHDEFQVEVKESDADKFGSLAVASIQAAGIQLGLRCALDGEYKVGNNWADTH